MKYIYTYKKWCSKWFRKIWCKIWCPVKICSFFRFYIWSNCKLEMTLRYIYILYIYTSTYTYIYIYIYILYIYVYIFDINKRIIIINFFTFKHFFLNIFIKSNTKKSPLTDFLKLAWVGFEPTTTEFYSDALTHLAIKPWV